jgi:hypothetical protein
VHRPGRNDPCPCGSGLKYKRCCLKRLEALPRYSREERALGLARLVRFTDELLPSEGGAALEELWAEWPDGLDRLDEVRQQMSVDVLGPWLWLDRPLADGRLIVERVLAEDPPATAGERRYLELLRDSGMRLYEVVDQRPGVSLTLRDVLDETEVTVRERTASRELRRSELLAARIVAPGASGEPEIETGVLAFPPLLRESLVAELEDWRRDFRQAHPGARDRDFYKQVVPFLHSFWASAILEPRIPRLKNTDGEDLLITRTHFDVRDAARLVQVLDQSPELERGDREGPWHWTGANRAGQPVSLGTLALDGTTLTLETNSALRGAHGRALVEGLAGDAIAHRATSHEDLTRAVVDGLRSPPDDPRSRSESAEIPPEVLEDLTLDHYARYYRQWVDEAIPALDGQTPRAAARDPALRPRLARLIRDLEGMYQGALRRNEPAYDPSWMWAELGLVDARGPAHPPPLAHERWGQALPGWDDLCRAVAGRARERPGFDEVSSTLSEAELRADLDVRRFLTDQAGSLPRPDLPPPAATGTRARLIRRLHWAVNFELHRRKTFWVDGSLAYLLGQTELDVVGEDLRLPFACFALVFTDRPTLSLVERLLAGDPTCPLAGQMLRVATVYVREERGEGGRVLRIGFAPDALGSDPPHLVEHAVSLPADARVQVIPDADRPLPVRGGERPVPIARPLPGLLQVTINAILYATSAGVEPEVRPSPRAPAARGATETPEVFSAGEVYFLPGKIAISHVRRLQELERVPSGRQLLHRFMVRGHWRRPAPSWKEQRMRWIEPYWKGPDLAAVIERTYALTP